MIKKVLYSLAIIGISAIMLANFTSCSDDDSSSTGPSDLKLGTMTAKVDGKSFTANNAQAMKFTEQNLIVSGVMLEGFTISKSISITVTETGTNTLYTGQGFYQISPIGKPSEVTTYHSKSIKYKITSYTDKEMSGTFDFTGTLDGGTETMTIKDGKFKVAIVN